MTQKKPYRNDYETYNDFQALWTYFSDEHSGGWSVVKPPIKETYGSSSFWFKPNVQIRLTIDQTYYTGKKGSAVGNLVAVAALRRTYDGTETISEGYGAGHDTTYTVARYVPRAQPKIDQVKLLIEEFALRNASNPLDLWVSAPQGSWQKIRIKNPGFDAQDELILWLQVREALSFN